MDHTVSPDSDETECLVEAVLRAGEIDDAIDRALAAGDCGDQTAMLLELRRLAEFGLDALTVAVWEVASTAAELLHAAGSGPGDSALVEIELLGSGSGFTAGEPLDAPLRTALRLLVSLAGGDQQDAMVALDELCVAGSTESAVVLVHLLMWTARLRELAGPEAATATIPRQVTPTDSLGTLSDSVLPS